VGGGIMPVFSMLFPRKPIDISEHLQALPADNTVPGLTDWRWIHVPGHSPGQVALFRESDRTLLAADAVVTTKQESALSIARQTPVLSGPPAYFTIDWDAAEQSVRTLADLDPEVLATGHGRPFRGTYMRQALRTLADNFQSLAVPNHGRYVEQPALWDEGGVVYVPKRDPRQDRAVWAVIGVVVLGSLLAYAFSGSGNKKRLK
jgi:glyoxylase-like metal-dependent hydrolase (beta-lactamase superfamily II)